MKFLLLLSVRLSEELVSSQISEMAAWNQISGLEKQCNQYLAESEKKTKEIEELLMKLNTEAHRHFEQKRLTILVISIFKVIFCFHQTILYDFYYRKVQEHTSSTSGFSDNALPLEFFQLLVASFTQRSVECRELWYRLLEAKEELQTLKTNTEERKISHQQTLELQNALQATHSDLDCQRVTERWASQFTELRIKVLRLLYCFFNSFHPKKLPVTKRTDSFAVSEKHSSV